MNLIRRCNGIYAANNENGKDLMQGAMEDLEFDRCAIYARFSTKLQRDTSLKDQERCCRELAAAKGWEVLDEQIYTDAGLSGCFRANRPGLVALERAVKEQERRFNRVLFDDTSRLSRDLSDVLKLVRVFNHYGVQLYFIKQQLDSANPQFEMLLTMHGMIDSQTISRIRAKSHEGVKGRILAGYNGGSIPYGYRGIREDSDTPNAFGQAASKGTRLEVVDEQAIYIRRVMEEFADGRSVWGISTRLNSEGVPWPHNKHGKWTSDAVKRILHNEKYRGVNAWNLTSQKKDPDTGQVIKRPKPTKEHLRPSAPHLRIVADELWDRVQARLKYLSDKQNARRLAGWNRAKVREYPYSGLLFCGLCGSRLRIGGIQGKGVYECPKHRSFGDNVCPNALRIREEAVTRQITEALTDQLLVPEAMNSLVAGVFKEMQEALNHQKSCSLSGGFEEWETARRSVASSIKNLLKAIEGTGSVSLAARLVAQEKEEQRLVRLIESTKAANKSELTEADVHALVVKNVTSLLEVLKADVALARQVLQRSIEKMTLYPGEEDGKAVYLVIGEMDLFTPPEEPINRVLLSVSGTLNAQQHTVDRFFRFMITFEAAPEVDCLLVKQFCDLLEARPQLQGTPIAPSEWSQLLRDFIPDGPEKPDHLGYGAIARCFWANRMQLERRLILTKTQNPKNQGHLYQLQLRPTAEVLDGFEEVGVEQGEAA